NRRCPLGAMEYAAAEARRMVPPTVPTVTSTEIVKPRGQFVRIQACTKPSPVGGVGSANALPWAACSVVLNAMDIVTYSGASTVRVHRASTSVVHNALRSRRGARGGCESATAVGTTAEVAALIRRTPFRGSGAVAAVQVRGR